MKKLFTMTWVIVALLMVLISKMYPNGVGGFLDS